MTTVPTATFTYTPTGTPTRTQPRTETCTMTSIPTETPTGAPSSTPTPVPTATPAHTRTPTPINEVINVSKGSAFFLTWFEIQLEAAKLPTPAAVTQQYFLAPARLSALAHRLEQSATDAPALRAITRDATSDCLYANVGAASYLTCDPTAGPLVYWVDAMPSGVYWVCLVLADDSISAYPVPLCISGPTGMTVEATSGPRSVRGAPCAASDPARSFSAGDALDLDVHGVNLAAGDQYAFAPEGTACKDRDAHTVAGLAASPLGYSATRHTFSHTGLALEPGALRLCYQREGMGWQTMRTCARVQGPGSGLSAGAWAGIGTGVGAAAVLVISVAAWWWFCGRRSVSLADQEPYSVAGGAVPGRSRFGEPRKGSLQPVQTPVTGTPLPSMSPELKVSSDLDDGYPVMSPIGPDDLICPFSDTTASEPEVLLEGYPVLASDQVWPVQLAAEPELEGYPVLAPHDLRLPQLDAEPEFPLLYPLDPETLESRPASPPAPPQRNALAALAAFRDTPRAPRAFNRPRRPDRAATPPASRRAFTPPARRRALTPTARRPPTSPAACHCSETPLHLDPDAYVLSAPLTPTAGILSTAALTPTAAGVLSPALTPIAAGVLSPAAFTPTATTLRSPALTPTAAGILSLATPTAAAQPHPTAAGVRSPGLLSPTTSAVPSPALTPKAGHGYMLPPLQLQDAPDPLRFRVPRPTPSLQLRIPPRTPDPTIPRTSPSLWLPTFSVPFTDGLLQGQSPAATLVSSQLTPHGTLATPAWPRTPPAGSVRHLLDWNLMSPTSPFLSTGFATPPATQPSALLETHPDASRAIAHQPPATSVTHPVSASTAYPDTPAARPTSPPGTPAATYVGAVSATHVPRPAASQAVFPAAKHLGLPSADQPSPATLRSAPISQPASPSATHRGTQSAPRPTAPPETHSGIPHMPLHDLPASPPVAPTSPDSLSNAAHPCTSPAGGLSPLSPLSSASVEPPSSPPVTGLTLRQQPILQLQPAPFPASTEPVNGT